MGLTSLGSLHMLNHHRSGRTNAQAGPPHLIQCHEKASFRKDTKIMLGCVLGPIKVVKKAIQLNNALEFHPVVLVVASINQSMKNARATSLEEGAVNEM